jgi:hypothetical protein
MLRALTAGLLPGLPDGVPRQCGGPGSSCPARLLPQLSSRLAARTVALPGRLVGEPDHLSGRQGTHRGQNSLCQADCAIATSG